MLTSGAYGLGSAANAPAFHAAEPVVGVAEAKRSTPPHPRMRRAGLTGTLTSPGGPHGRHPFIVVALRLRADPTARVRSDPGTPARRRVTRSSPGRWAHAVG